MSSTTHSGRSLNNRGGSEVRELMIFKSGSNKNLPEGRGKLGDVGWTGSSNLRNVGSITDSVHGGQRHRH